jgi:LacI family transcriptional regulator
MVTIREVARQAEVSPATVSRVFGRGVDVHPETRQRVLAVAQALNYQPLAAARNMRRVGRGETSLCHVVGVIHFRDSAATERDSFSSEVMAAVETALEQRGYGMRLLHWSPEGGVPWDVGEGGMDGILARGTGPVLYQAAQSVPIVTLDCHDPGLPAYAISPDYESAGYQGVQALLARGRRRLALAIGEPEGADAQWFAQGVYRGACRAAAEAGIALTTASCCPVMGTPRAGYQHGLPLLRDPATRPDAILASDGGLLGLYRAAAELGLRIPADLALIGINGLPSAEFLAPPATTIDVGIAALAARAVAVLTATIEGGTRRTGLEWWPVTLIPRASLP